MPDGRRSYEHRLYSLSCHHHQRHAARARVSRRVLRIRKLQNLISKLRMEHFGSEPCPCTFHCCKTFSRQLMSWSQPVKYTHGFNIHTYDSRSGPYARCLLFGFWSIQCVCSSLLANRLHGHIEPRVRPLVQSSTLNGRVIEKWCSLQIKETTSYSVLNLRQSTRSLSSLAAARFCESALRTPVHLLLNRSPNIGPLISRWELDRFKNWWNKSFRTSRIPTLLYQQFSNLLISQRDMSCPILGALSNNRWSWGRISVWNSIATTNLKFSTKMLSDFRVFWL